MKPIEITTAHNVTIEYELAKWIERLLAQIIDLIFIGIIILSLSLAMGSVGISGTMIIVISSSIFLLYVLVQEILLDGQTWGKKIMKIKVIKLNGNRPDINNYFTRAFLALLENYLSTGVLATIFIFFSDKNQRLGDMLAGTVIIRVATSNKFSLDDILEIKSLEEYTPTYPQVKNLAEKDLLIIKNVVDQAANYPNKAHIGVVHELAKKICGILEVDYALIKKKPINFLKTLIKDFVILTR